MNISDVFKNDYNVCKNEHEHDEPKVKQINIRNCMKSKGYSGGKRKKSRKRRPKREEPFLHDMVFLGGLDNYRYVKRNTRRSYR